MRVPGPLLFARYAYPPNALGYCGPNDALALIGHTTAGESGPDLVALARQFAGAWPYLQLIAASAGRADPLDEAVVEAYWLGNRLLSTVDSAVFAAHLVDRFETRAGRGLADLSALARLGAVAHHNFHVFAVYPWVGMLRAGPTSEPLRVLDACRIRWGRVLDVAVGIVAVSSQPLLWTGTELRLGPPRTEHVLCASEQGRLAPTVRSGDLVSMHWDWVCDVLTPRQARRLRAVTAHTLSMTNEALSRPVAAAVLD
jgi:Family of unknown function (DUF6390)